MSRTTFTRNYVTVKDIELKVSQFVGGEILLSWGGKKGLIHDEGFVFLTEKREYVISGCCPCQVI